MGEIYSWPNSNEFCTEMKGVVKRKNQIRELNPVLDRSIDDNRA